MTTTCATLTASTLTADEATARARALKAVADPVRLRLLDVIRTNPSQEACVCQLTEVVGLAQPTVSHHLKTLVDAGLLERDRRGTWAWYRLIAERIGEVAGYVAGD